MLQYFLFYLSNIAYTLRSVELLALRREKFFILE